MVDPIDLKDERYVRYADLLDQLHQQFPTAGRERIARIITAENDAITGGFLLVVEMLERETALSADGGEVVA